MECCSSKQDIQIRSNSNSPLYANNSIRLRSKPTRCFLAHLAACHQDSREWRALSEQLPRRTEHAALLWRGGGALLVYGGYSGSSAQGYRNDLLSIELGGCTTELLPVNNVAADGIPVPTSAHTIALCGGYLYKFGGWTGKQNLRSLHRYHLASGIWSELDTSPPPNSHDKSLW